MNIYKNYCFTYDENLSYIALRKALKENGIKTLNDFINFISEYDELIPYDTIVAYYNGKRRINIELLKYICNKINCSCQDIILPNGSCYYDNKINEENLDISCYNSYDNYLYDFIYEDNIKAIVESDDIDFNDEYYKSEDFKERFLSSIKKYEKILCYFLFLVQKYCFSYLTRNETNGLNSAICNIYPEVETKEDIFEKIKTIKQENFYFDFYKYSKFTYLSYDNPSFIKLFLLCDEEIVSYLMSYLNPVEKDVLLTIINENNTYETLKKLLKDNGAKVNSLLKSDIEIIESNDDNIYKSINDSIINLTTKALNYSSEEYKKGYMEDEYE